MMNAAAASGTAAGSGSAYGVAPEPAAGPRPLARFAPALVAALVLNVALLTSAALLSRDRALPQDMSDPVAVSLVSLKPPTVQEDVRKTPPPPPRPKPRPEFEPDLLRPAIGAPAPVGVAVRLDPALFSGGPARGDFIFNAADLDQPPVAVVQAAPEYPFRARQRDIEGYVTIRFLVRVDGSTDRVEVIDSKPRDLFEDALLRVVPGWKYRPGMIDGQPVPTWVEKTVRFDLSN